MQVSVGVFSPDRRRSHIAAGGSPQFHLATIVVSAVVHRDRHYRGLELMLNFSAGFHPRLYATATIVATKNVQTH